MDDANRPTTGCAARIREVLDDCVRRRASGEVLPDGAVLAAHPDLLPELADALRALAVVGAAVPRVQAGPTGSTGESSAACADTLLASTALTAPKSAGGDLAGTGFALRRLAPHDWPGSPDRRAEIALPPQLGPVQLVREIGRGGMGAVFLGYHRLLKREVAVKFLLDAPAGSSDPSFERFLQGAQAAARVRHAGLTTIHHADLFEGIPYLVMEYIAGPSLAEVLRGVGRLSVPAAVAAVVATTEAVAALHQANIVHRDIKPHNVLLDAHGQVFVTDFGLTLNRPPLGGAAGLTAAGTVAYMAPEMFDGVVSPRSDVYALGIMTFELLTGTLPFRAATLGEWQRCHTETPLPVEPLHAAGVDAALIEVLQRATHKNAMFRYKTAAQFLAALQSASPGAAESRDGARMLAGLACRPDGAASGAPVSPSADGASSSYFDEIHDRASEKSGRRATDAAQAQGGGVPTSPPGSDDDTRPDSETLPLMLRTLDPPSFGRKLRIFGILLVAIILIFRTLYLGIRWNDWPSVGLLVMIVSLACLSLWSSDPQWVRRLRYRLANGLYPELARFPSADERGRAWAEASAVAGAKPGMWVFVGACILGYFALKLFASVRTASFVQPGIFFFAIPALFLVMHMLYARQVRYQLRLRLVALGVPICIPCGYDLRGQVVPRCPECGTEALAPGGATSASTNAVARAKRRRVWFGIAAIALFISFMIWSSFRREEEKRILKLVWDLGGRAASMRGQGDLAGAEREYRRALGIRGSVRWDDSREFGDLSRELGATLTQLNRFAEAEQVLLQAEKAYQQSDSNLLLSDWRDLNAARVKLYEAWHAAEPDQGHDRQATVARAKLAESESKLASELAEWESKRHNKRQ